eukprot:5305888-Pyramimonas_sp.AAC.1
MHLQREAQPHTWEAAPNACCDSQLPSDPVDGLSHANYGVENYCITWQGRRLALSFPPQQNPSGDVRRRLTRA